MAARVGVVAIQGDYAKHTEAIARADSSIEIIEVRTPDELAEVERVIVPGGESTTVGLLMERYGLGDALKRAAQEGMPMWGTCMGMIMMSKEVVGLKQYTLGLLDVAIERNAFGAQVHSFEDEVAIAGLRAPIIGVFIRAPAVSRMGKDVEELGRYRDKVVAVRQGRRLGTAFHPELTNDSRIHELFLKL